MVSDKKNENEIFHSKKVKKKNPGYGGFNEDDCYSAGPDAKSLGDIAHTVTVSLSPEKRKHDEWIQWRVTAKPREEGTVGDSILNPVL